ncbi:MAG: HAD-IA family hydrolase [Lachnospiraceae bacterium]|nr:HAD-IA family hydrolase [Lachnospiraceae bacterium]
MCEMKVENQNVKKYNAIIWDLDGTLLNTLEDLRDAVNYALRAQGFPERTLEEIRCFVGNGVRKLMERAVPDGENNPKFQETFDIFKKYYDGHNMVKTKPYDGIMDCLKYFHDNGVPMAIVTNKIQSAAEMLRENVFEGLIPLAVGDGVVPTRKPDPQGVHYAMEHLGLNDEKYNVVYIGDSEVDAATAENAGLDCLLCLWGFRSQEELADKPHVAFVNEPAEIMDYIEV